MVVSQEKEPVTVGATQKRLNCRMPYGLCTCCGGSSLIRKVWRKYNNSKRKTLRSHRKGTIKQFAWS